MLDEYVCMLSDNMTVFNHKWKISMWPAKLEVKLAIIFSIGCCFFFYTTTLKISNLSQYVVCDTACVLFWLDVYNTIIVGLGLVYGI